MKVQIETPLGNVVIHSDETGVNIILPNTALTDKDISIVMPQCDVPGIVSNYVLSVKHFSEHERENAVENAGW